MKIKQKPEDFIVEEVTGIKPKTKKDKYKIYKMEMDTCCCNFCNAYFYDKNKKISVKAAAKLISNILFDQRPNYMMTSLLVG